MKRQFINTLNENTPAKISGWVDTFRDTRYMIFIVLKDITGVIQVSIDKQTQPELVEALTGVIAHSVVSFEGQMKLSEYVKLNGKEFIPTSVKVESIAEALPIDKDSSLDQRLNYRFIDLRDNEKTLIFKIQSLLTKAMRDYLYENKFIEIHSPKIIGSASESGSDVFELQYFDTKAYLAQSPQFYKQMAMAAGFERIFETGPVFRAEQSYTSRHSTEFTGFDLEISFIESFEDVMKIEEELLTYALGEVNKVYATELKEVFGKELVVPTTPFPRMTLKEVYDELEERYGFTVPKSEQNDLTTEAEKLSLNLVKDKFNHEFLFVTDYPKDKRAFYHMRENDRPLGFDLIWRGVEITTGAQREHRYDILKAQAKEKGLDKDVEFYLEFFKYGCPPHGGFGLGLDRLTMLLLGLPSLKEAEFIFRGPTRIYP